MSHFGDFMDGVPVKISEKYKRPPRIDLPHSVHQCPLRSQSLVDNVKYCTIFETNVLVKIKEIRNAKETKKNERKHRLQLLEEAKQKRLDAIAAAEAEEKLKQLNVSEVSYPSTEEISTLSPDEKDKNFNTNSTLDDVNEPNDTVMSTDNHQPSCHNTIEIHSNILQPIQVKSNCQQTNLIDDPDPLQELILSGKVTKMPYKNIDTLTYKDFENDTSSPFDNVELNTINDMEQLAQVLQSQRDAATSFHQPVYNMDQTFSVIPNCASEANMGVMYLPNNYIDQPIQGQGVSFSSQHYPVSNGYYVSTEHDNAPSDNVGCTSEPQYHYYTPSHPYSIAETTYYSNQCNNSITSNQSYVPPSYYYPQASQYPNTSSYMQKNIAEQNSVSKFNSQNTIKSRSRSVPDIIKELDEEIQHAKQRAAEINLSPAISRVTQPISSNKDNSSNVKKEHRRRRKEEQLPNPYDKLPPKVQQMCKNIEGMGFPLDRVARVCTLVGDDDKKIIEGLLLLGDLMDLGFSEGRVSAALAKHEFNRDKTLDELVS